MKRKPILLKAIRPNAGIEQAYRAALDRLLREVRDDVLAVIEQHKDQRPTPIALDANPLADAIDRLMIQWIEKLSTLGDEMAGEFVRQSARNHDFNLMRQLRTAGFTVRFQMTKFTQEALQASIGMNVGLIKSIPTEYLADVSKYVYEATSAGFDAATLTHNLQHAYHIGRNRAKLIARDQTNKAHAVIEKARRQELGITKAVWRHSGGAKVPRPSHVAANGKVFEIDKGMYLDGEWVLPGQAINCFPGETPLSDAEGVKKLWRRWYRGELSVLSTEGGKTIKATPNHPVLTQRGWIGIKEVRSGDYLFERLDERGGAIKENVQGAYPSFSEVFDAASSYIVPSTSAGSLLQFHGDGADLEIETIDFEGVLPNIIDPIEIKKFFEFLFPVANHVIKGVVSDGFNATYNALSGLFCAPKSIVGSARLLFALASGKVGHLDGSSLGISSDVDAIILKSASDYISRNAKTLGDLEFANAGFIQGNDVLSREIVLLLSSIRLWGGDATGFEFLGDAISSDGDSSSRVLNVMALHQYQSHRVINTSSVYFSGHVYNLHNEKNWYSAQGLVSHNCGCVSRAVLEF